MPKLQRENLNLKKKVAQLEEENKIVQWYLEVLEGGVDTKEIVREFGMLKQEHRVYKEAAEKRVDRLLDSNIKHQKECEKAKEFLKQQQEKVVQPLIKEISKREKEA